MNLERIKQLLSKYAKYLLLALLMYTPLFGSLDTLPIRIWDESRITINAVEMYFNGNYIVPNFNDSPDMWNTKPPLLLWMQVFWMKLIGINEIAIRLPSALAAFFTCIGLLMIALRYFQNFWLGFIFIMVLITTPGYVQAHVTRTGDYDSLLIFFTTLSSLFFFLYTETFKNKHLYLFFILLTGAVLTKGIAGLLFSPALFIYLLMRKQLVPLLKNRHFYFGLLVFLVFGVGYYFIREFYNEGYLYYISQNELGGRYLVSQGDQPDDKWFYFDKLTKELMADRYLLVPCGLIVGFLSLDQKLRRFTLFITLAIVTFMMIISFGKTRLEHYAAPLFPFLALSIGIFVFYLFNLLGSLKPSSGAESPKAIPLVFLFLLFLFPYQKIFAKTYSPTELWSTDHEFYAIGRFYKDALNGHHDLNNAYLIYSGYDAQLMFYMHALRDRGVKTWKKTFEEVKPGDKLIISQWELQQEARRKYEYTQKWYKDGITILTVTALK